MSSKGFHKAIFAALVSSLLLTVFLATPAVAQGDPRGEPVFESQEGSGYEIYEDGTFVIGGDVIGSCDAVLQETQQTGTQPSGEVLRQVEICTEAGFPPEGSESLPETGGPPLSILVASGLLLGAALCSLGIRR